MLNLHTFSLLKIGIKTTLSKINYIKNIVKIINNYH